MRPIQLILKPNAWSCAVTSFAMALGVSVQELIESIGHDGSAIAWPDLDEPRCRRGFHSQELIDQVLFRDRTCTLIEARPQIGCPEPHRSNMPPMDVFPRGYTINRFLATLEFARGVIEGQSGRNNHAMAFENGKVFDPDGRVYEANLESFEARNFQPYRAWSIR